MKRWLCLMLVLLSLIISSSFVEARSHRFLDLQIEVKVGADGVVRVTETHTVQFDGTFSGMYQWIDTSRDLEVRDMVVSEKGIPYTRLERNSPGPTGTYYVNAKTDELYVDWSFEATDEVREFQLSYVLDNVVLKHKDAAEFYYQFVGKQWEEPREHVRVVLSLPDGAHADEVLAWGYGPLHATVTVESPSRVVWEVERLPAKTFVEGRVVFPTRLVPGATRVTNETRLAGMLADEEKKQENLVKSQKRKALDPYVAMGVAGLVYLFMVFVWHNYGKLGPGYKDKYFKQLPAKYPPAELAILYRGTTINTDFTATIFDLARRGFFVVEEEVSLQGKGSQKEPSYTLTKKEITEGQFKTLKPYETQVLEFLFAGAVQDEISLDGIKEHVEDHPKRYEGFLDKWGEGVKEAAKVHQFYDQEAKKVLWYLIPGLLLLPLAILPFVLGMNWTGATCLFMSFAATIVVATAGERRSAEGHEEYTKWKAFRRYLKESSRVETARVGSLGIWEEFLPYAIILGVADQMLKQLAIRFPNLEENGQHFGSYWFLYHRPGGLASFRHMTSTVGQSMTSITAPASSGGGSRGFSGGGGGGFGGGGGGAR